jgi:hypothetical protein
MNTTKLFLFLLITSLSVACNNEKDITEYYFPVKELQNGKVYEYRFVGNPSINPQFWYYQTLKADPKTSDKAGQFFTGTLYNAKYQIQQIVNEEVVSNGMMLNDLYLYMYDTTGVQTRIQPKILSPSVFPFEIADTSHIYLYKIKFAYPNDTTHTTTIIKNRRFAGKTTYNYKGKKYDCVVFENRESVDDDLNGRWHNEFQSKELYAKGLGLIYYKKTLGQTVLEYELSDIYEMSDLEKKFSEQKN